MQRLTSQFGAVSFGVRAAACTAIGDCLSVIMPEEKEALKADLIRIKKGICTTTSTKGWRMKPFNTLPDLLPAYGNRTRGELPPITSSSDERSTTHLFVERDVN